MCQNCQENHSSKSSSSFVFGIILGAVLGAVLAIVIYKKSKGKVLEDLQNWLTGFFGSPKIKKNKIKSAPAPVVIPVRKKSPPKVFIRK